LKDIVGAHCDVPLPVDEIINYATQVAEGLQAAHEKGIIHRDIKSANIMLTKKGHVKIMDFGLAKVKGSQQLTKASTTLGTVAYMSPEQIQNSEIDARADIFSFGVVLYEMLTGKFPFAGDYESAVIYSILNEEPLPLQELRADVPSEIMHVVYRTIEKDPEDRFQSMSEIVRELRWLNKKSGRSSSSIKIDTAVKKQVQPASEKQQKAPAQEASTLKKKILKNPVIAGLLILVALVILFIAVRPFLFETEKGGQISFTNLKISRLTITGKAIQGSISPDGKYIVYVQVDKGKQSLWLRQIATTSNVQIAEPAEASFQGTTFSHDGNYIYFVINSKKDPLSAVYEMPVLGGTPKKILSDLRSTVTLSPDGKKIAFVRSYLDQGEEALMIANIDGSNEEKLTSRFGADFFDGGEAGPSWSPDGKIIACSAGSAEGGFEMGVMAIDAETGEQKWISDKRWQYVNRVEWSKSGDGLVIVAVKQSDNKNQLWFVSFPDGEVTRITNDLNDYDQRSLSLTSQDFQVAAAQSEINSNLWIVNLSEKTMRRITSGSNNFDGVNGIAISSTGKIIYSSNSSGNDDIWSIDMDGDNRKQITSHPKDDDNPTIPDDFGFIIFSSLREKTSHIWRMNPDGSNIQQLTTAEDYSPYCSPDGKWAVYYGWGTGKMVVSKVSTDGGEPIALSEKPSNIPRISPDGKYVACFYQENPDEKFRVAILSIDGGDPIRFVPRPSTARGTFRWSADGKSILYIDEKEGFSNIWSQSIDGGIPKQLTFFDSDFIYNFAQSPDGEYIVCARGPWTSDLVLISQQN
jgi:serine/threonine protein kinase